MIIAVPPSLERVRRFLLDAASAGRKGRALLLVPSALMRAEAASFLLERGPVGGLEITTPAALASAVTGLEREPRGAAAALLHSLLAAESDRIRSVFGFEPEPGRASSFLSLFEGFRHERLSPADIPERFGRTPAAAKARLLSRLYAAWLEACRSRPAAGEPALLEKGAAVLRRLGAGFESVHVAGFYSMTPLQADFLSALVGACGRRAEILLELPAPLSFSLQTPAGALYEPLRSALAALGLPLVREKADGPGAYVRRVAAYDTAAEISAAARWVLDRIGEGIAAGELAVLFPRLDARGARLAALLESRGVPCSLAGDVQRRTPAFRFLTAALALSRADSCTRGELEEILASPCLRSVPDRRTVWNAILGRSGRHEISLSEWADAAAATASGLLRASAGRENVELGGGRAPRAFLETAASELVSFLRELHALGGPSKAAFLSRFRDLAARVAEKDEAEELAETVEKALSAASRLPPAEAALAALSAESCAASGHVLPGSVAVASMLAGRHLLRSRIFLAGLTERDFPFRRLPLPFLAEVEVPEGFAGLDRVAESRHLLALFTSRPREAVLSCPEAEGLRAVKPSCLLPPGEVPEPAALLGGEWETASVLASLPFDSPGWRKAAVRLSGMTGGRGGLGAAAALERSYAELPSPHCGLPGKDAFTAPLLDGLKDAPLNVTRVGDYARCPLRFFFSTVLALSRGVGEEDPFSPPAWGSILHELLARFYMRWKAEKGDESLALERDAALAMLAEEARALADAAPPLPGLVALLLRRMAEGGADVPFARAFVEAEASGGYPVPLAVETAVDGELEGLRLAGRIDRLDPFGPRGEGRLIVDYKTGSPPSQKDVREGREPQLALYSLLIAGKDAPPRAFCHYPLRGRIGRSRIFEGAEAAGAEKAALEALRKLGGSLDTGAFDICGQAREANRCPFSGPCRSLCAERGER